MTSTSLASIVFSLFSISSWLIVEHQNLSVGSASTIDHYKFSVSSESTIEDATVEDAEDMMEDAIGGLPSAFPLEPSVVASPDLGRFAVYVMPLLGLAELLCCMLMIKCCRTKVEVPSAPNVSLPGSAVRPDPQQALHQQCRCACPQRTTAVAAPATPPVPVVLQLGDRTGEAARSLAERGFPAAQIATLLQIDDTAVNAAMHAVHSNLQTKLDELLTEDEDLCCPVSLMLLSDPVVASDGFVYEKASLENILSMSFSPVSPMTREPLQSRFFPIVQCRRRAFEFRETRSKALLVLADEAITAGQQLIALEVAEKAAEYINGLSEELRTLMETKVKEIYSRLGRCPAPEDEPALPARPMLNVPMLNGHLSRSLSC